MEKIRNTVTGIIIFGNMAAFLLLKNYKDYFPTIAIVSVIAYIAVFLHTDTPKELFDFYVVPLFVDAGALLLIIGSRKDYIFSEAATAIAFVVLNIACLWKAVMLAMHLIDLEKMKNGKV